MKPLGNNEGEYRSKDEMDMQKDSFRTQFFSFQMHSFRTHFLVDVSGHISKITPYYLNFYFGVGVFL